MSFFLREHPYLSCICLFVICIITYWLVHDVVSRICDTVENVAETFYNRDTGDEE